MKKMRRLAIELLSGFLKTCALAAEAELAQRELAPAHTEAVSYTEIQRLVA